MVQSSLKEDLAVTGAFIWTLGVSMPLSTEIPSSCQVLNISIRDPKEQVDAVGLTLTEMVPLFCKLYPPNASRAPAVL